MNWKSIFLSGKIKQNVNLIDVVLIVMLNILVIWSDCDVEYTCHLVLV